MLLNLLSFAGTMKVVGGVLLAILILLLMITVHEFGHYIAGKIFKFKINEFAIGFGPALFKKQNKESGEVFSIRAFPLGGYCAFEGEDENNPHPGAFNNKKPWQRIIVLISGALMNFMTALLIIIISFAIFGQLLLTTAGIEPPDVNEASDYAGFIFEEGDVIKSIDGKTVYMTTDLISALKGREKGDIVGFTVYRGGSIVKHSNYGESVGGELIDIQIKLRESLKDVKFDDSGRVFKALGIAVNENNYYMIGSVGRSYGFFETVGKSFGYAFKIAGTIFKILGQLLTGNLSLSAMGGPVTTIKMTAQVASMGLLQFFEITAFIGINLAVFNLLPIPALDGSKIVFTSIEWVRKKPINRKVEGIIHFAGFVFLIGFAILVDLLQIF